MSKFISIILISLSCITLYFYFGSLVKPKINKPITITKEKTNLVVLKNEDSTEKMELEKYLVGVVACEMPVLYGSEALKTQAIASRTYAVYKSNNNLSLAKTTDDQCFITDAEMKEKWGTKYDEYKKIVEDAVNDTRGTIITKDDKVLVTFYFSTSNGYTEDSMSVFKTAGIQSVPSSWDKESNNYRRDITINKDDLENLLGKFNNIKIVKRNNTHHVEIVKVDSKEYTGIEFRKKLNLRSTDFEITKNGDQYTFTTYGYGHGVGMSQYGASHLAKNGYNYEDILKYYYGNIEFVKL